MVEGVESIDRTRGLENRTKWYYRKHMNVVGFAFLVIGIWVGTIFLPAAPILSILLFALIAGVSAVLIGYKHGVLINYKRKKARWSIFVVFGIMSWLYAFYTLFVSMRAPAFGGEFNADFLMKVFPVVALVTLPFAWFGRLKISWDTMFPGVSWLLCLFVILPFVGSCMWDYNVKADTSLPEVMTVTIVHKDYDDELGYSILVQTLDGKPSGARTSCWIHVSESFYDQHDWGSTCEIRVREGALGYPWVEGYVD